MNILKLISSAIKSLVSAVTPKKGIEYPVENTLDFIHDIKKEKSPEVEAEKTLIEAKSKLREKRKAPKKIKVPKDPA